MGLGVSMVFSREKNLEIIGEKYLADSLTTRKQVIFLKHLAWNKHEKGSINCDCLGCQGLQLINSEDMKNLKSLKSNIDRLLKPYRDKRDFNKTSEPRG